MYSRKPKALELSLKGCWVSTAHKFKFWDPRCSRGCWGNGVGMRLSGSGSANRWFVSQQPIHWALSRCCELLRICEWKIRAQQFNASNAERWGIVTRKSSKICYDKLSLQIMDDSWATNPADASPKNLGPWGPTRSQDACELHQEALEIVSWGSESKPEGIPDTMVCESSETKSVNLRIKELRLTLGQCLNFLSLLFFPLQLAQRFVKNNEK